MNIRKTLQNPFVLMGQGFVVGAALFFSTNKVDAPAPEAKPVELQSRIADRA